MRIAISGTANTGKTTLIKNFLERWPMYKKGIGKDGNESYRSLIKEKKLKHSTETTPETQMAILEWMIDRHQQYPKGSKVFFDRCPLDALVYSFHAFGKNVKGFDKKFMDKMILLVKNSFVYIDIIFWIPFSSHIKIENDKFRETDLTYIKEVDNIFASLYNQYLHNIDADIFFPKNDCPGIIQIDGSCQTIDRRLNFIGEYIDENGELFGTEKSIFNPENSEFLEQILSDQEQLLSNEQKQQELMNKFGLK